MKRTQIYLDDEIYEFLENESKNKHKSMSEIIRETIKEKIQYKNKNLIKNLNMAFGIWEDRNIEINKYIENIRKDRIK